MTQNDIRHQRLVEILHKYPDVDRRQIIFLPEWYGDTPPTNEEFTSAQFTVDCRTLDAIPKPGLISISPFDWQLFAKVLGCVFGCGLLLYIVLTLAGIKVFREPIKDEAVRPIAQVDNDDGFKAYQRVQANEINPSWTPAQCEQVFGKPEKTIVEPEKIGFYWASVNRDKAAPWYLGIVFNNDFQIIEWQKQGQFFGFEHKKMVGGVPVNVSR